MAQEIEARYWLAQPEGVAECRLCPHHCRIKPGQSGLCHARKNIDGRLIAWNYGKVTALALDPIEKKPLAFFLPGTRILSIGSFGCNFRCGFCQNWEIAQQEAPFRELSPAQLVDIARKMVPDQNIGLAFTYNEPLIGFEFVLECARLIRAAGLKNVLVTNGFIEPEPLDELLPWIDALNIDLKAWDGDFYSKICGGDIATVQQTITAAVAAGCHVEITTLLLPGLNDRDEDIRDLAAWLADINPEIPLHLTRHHPDYQMPEPPPLAVKRLQKLAELARGRLLHVLTGNV